MPATDVPKHFSDPAEFILHPTDFSQSSELAFAHALRLALENKAALSLLHVGDSESDDWDRFPAVRETLERWGLLEKGSRRADVAKMGIEVEKLVADDKNVSRAIAGYLARRPIDMLVLATAGRSGPAAWLNPSTAEQAARQTSVPALFVPGEGRGCVSLEDGQVTMDRVLIPVDHEPPCEAAIERGLRAIRAFGRSFAVDPASRRA